jgi:hypothetical protein
MSRPLVICLVVLTLLLQGVTQVSAAVLADSQSQHHCDGHAMAEEDCACCANGAMLNEGCAASCYMAIALPVALLDLPRVANGEHHSLVSVAATGPAYLPLNPPPIS